MCKITAASAWFRQNAKVLIIGTLLVLTLGVIDSITGFEVAFSVFYVLPIYLVTWNIGRRTGIIFAFFSAVIWFIADHLAPHDYSSALIPVWNFGVRLTFFLVTIYFVSELRSKLTRKRELERIFFHDILNLMAGIRGFAEFLKENPDQDKGEIHEIIYSAANQAIDQIDLQRVISGAESHELRVNPGPVGSRAVLEKIVGLFQHHPLTRNRRLRVDEGSADVQIVTDEVLLARVLENMLKNALEAAASGEMVTAGCRQLKDSVEFWVHNPGVIPADDQTRIFQRSFSTKGVNRGLGTFSMQLLSKVLHGVVTFTSTPETGTIFRARYPIIYED